MKRFFYLFLVVFISPMIAFSQTTLNGKVTEEGDSGEPLIGATVVLGSGLGAATDIDGAYSVNLSAGKYSVTISYVGYETQVIPFEVREGSNTLDVKLSSSLAIKEIEVTADIARDRETPVAFSNISTQKIQEELASQDLPMILNRTPGVYATQQGGGDGDARITIRGFNQRNIAVMLDGVPVNDMENGQVFWSNWNGLDNATRAMQVQRGLGASKIAIPAVGGTLNILTKGIESKRSVSGQLETATGNFMRAIVSMNSGRMKGGWGITAVGSYRRQDGWVEGTESNAFFYFLRIDKEIGKHLISFSAMGAPQSHGQRSNRQPIHIYNTSYARNLFEGNQEEYDSLRTYFSRPNTSLLSGRMLELSRNFIDTTGIGWRANRPGNYGTNYNPSWLYLDRNTLDSNRAIVQGQSDYVNTTYNYFHKPQITLRHFWDASSRFSISNVAYLSIASGGGTFLQGAFGPNDANGQPTAQNTFNNQLTSSNRRANTHLRASVNNHFWVGLLSTANFKISNELTLSGGVDLRTYKGLHYREVKDLFGGVSVTDNSDQNSPRNRPIGVGGKVGYNNDGLVNWGGAFAMLEYNWKKKLTAFVNLSGSMVSYKKIDYFVPKQVTVGDTTFNVTNVRPVAYNGVTYTPDSPEAQFQQTPWVNIPGYTAKIGGAYNFNKNHSLFVNAGYLVRANAFNNLFGGASRIGIGYNDEYKTQTIQSAEMGYSFRSDKLSANLNGYYTWWINKPLDNPPTYSDADGNLVPLNVNGLNALHRGIELDFAYEPFKWLAFEGVLSIADWRWQSGAKAEVTDNNGTLLARVEFDATDVHISDAAQTQVGGLVRVEPIKNLYFKLNCTYFGRNFANFDPMSLTLNRNSAGVVISDFRRKDSWQMPDYAVFDFNCGYTFKLGKNAPEMTIRGAVLNLMDNVFITDANNNGVGSGFDARSAAVFFGMGRRFNVSLKVAM